MAEQEMLWTEKILNAEGQSEGYCIIQAKGNRT